MRDGEKNHPPTDRYEFRLLPADPWRHPAADMCRDCGAWVADRDIHDRTTHGQQVVIRDLEGHMVAAYTEMEPIPDYVRPDQVDAWRKLSPADKEAVDKVSNPDRWVDWPRKPTD